MRYLSDFFWRYSWDVGTLATNDSEFHVCLSVCLFAYFLTKIRQRHISGSGWDIFLKFFGDIPGMLVHYFQIILNFMYVCQSVCLLTSSPKLDKGISPDLDDISFLNFFETFVGYFWTFSRSFWISCLSVSLLVGLLPYWNYDNTGISLVLDEISFWIFLEAFLGCWYTFSK